MHKKYCLVITDDHSRFTWVFFLATKDETSVILKNFIKEIENLVDKKVKIIRCDNGTEFKNKAMDEICKEKADSKLPTTFWAEAVSTACYVQNRVLIVKPHNKTPYELFRGIKLALTFMKPFGCHVTILNTLDSFGKFDGKSDEGFFVGYSLSSKAYRVYNTRTKKVEENLHVGFLENKPMLEGKGPTWLFDIDSLTKSMNYVPVTAGTISNESAGKQGDQNADTFPEKDETNQECIVMPIWKDASYFDSSSKTVGNGEPRSAFDEPKHVEDGPSNANDGKDKSEDDSSTKHDNTTDQPVNTAILRLNTAIPRLNTVGSSVNSATPEDMVGPSHSLEAPNNESLHDEYDTEVDLGNILNSYSVPNTPHTRTHINHPLTNVIGDIQSSVQTRRMKEPAPEQGFLSAIYEAKAHEDLHTCLFACFLSQEEPKRISKALSDPAWVEAINKKDKRGIVIRNKARLVTQGHTQEESIDYDEVFAPIARIEAIRLFLAYASFMGFMVYQMDVKSAFLYGQIEKEVYVCQPPRFEDPDYPDKVYRVIKALYGLYQALRAWYETLTNYLLGNGFHRGKIDQTLFIKRQKGDILVVQIYADDIIFGSTKKELCIEFEKLMKDKFQMSSMGELTFFFGLQVQQRKDGIFISQDKYVDEILRKFNYTDVKSSSTPVDLEKTLVKDGDGTDVDEHLYRSMIRSFMYLTTSKPDIMFAVCACARFQVAPKAASHLLAVKRNFRYLKGKPTLGLWYPRDSPFELVAYTDSDYAGATQDRKSTTRGSEYVAAASCCGQDKQRSVVEYADTNCGICYPIMHYLRGGKLHQELTSPEQTASGKDFSNPLIVDSLLKTIWLSMHHIIISLLIHQMANLEFCDKHNMVAYLDKSDGSEGFHKIIDFLNRSHIQYALTKNPTIYISFIKQFWRTATANTRSDGKVEITTTIDGHVKTITEASLRRHLKLEDNDGVPNLPNSDIFEQFALIGYVTDSDKLTFQKGNFSPQWRFRIHTILHYLSPKKTSWEQFSSNIATVIICLATNKTYNFSKMIFEAMVKNIESPHKFLMYPRFIQICLNMQKKHLQPHNRTYDAHLLTNKVFNNMKRLTKGYTGVEVPLFASMLNAPSTSPFIIPSTHEPSPPPTSPSPPSTSIPQQTEPSPAEKEHVLTPRDSPLHVVHLHRSDEGRLQQTEVTNLVTKLFDRIGSLENDLLQTKKIYSTTFTKLIFRVKKLEKQVKTSKARRKAKIVLSEEEDATKDCSKQGRKISDIDQDPNIYLAQDDETHWFQDDIDVQEDSQVLQKQSHDTEVLLDAGEPTELVQDQGSSEKGQPKVSTAKTTLDTVGVSVSTAGVQLSTANIQKASQDQEKQRGVDPTKADPTKVIDWSDPSVIRYHAQLNRPRSVVEVRRNMCKYLCNQGNYKMKDFKGMSYDDIRPIFKRVWDQVNDFVPMDSELESQLRLKRKSKEVQEEPVDTQKIETEEVEEEVQQEDVEAEQTVEKESSKVSGKRRKSLARKKKTSKKQKLDEEETTDYEKEKEDLRIWLIVVPDEEAIVDPEVLHTRYPIMDWASQSLGDMHVYKIIRVVVNTSYHKTFESMLRKFNRQDLVDLHRLVMERFKDKASEGYSLMLWGDLKTMFEPDAEDEV
ncbi:putative ribonuclease H-like domain-containing protein [Tanacetum coccineum]